MEKSKTRLKPEYRSWIARAKVGWRSLKLYYQGKEIQARLLMLEMYEDVPEEAATT